MSTYQTAPHQILTCAMEPASNDRLAGNVSPFEVRLSAPLNGSAVEARILGVLGTDFSNFPRADAVDIAVGADCGIEVGHDDADLHGISEGGLGRGTLRHSAISVVTERRTGVALRPIPSYYFCSRRDRSRPTRNIEICEESP